MKLDWNLMRTILAHVEAETIREFLADANSLEFWKEGQLLSERLDQKTSPEVRVVLRHTQMLVQAGFIEGLEVRESTDGLYSVSYSPHPDLSLSGHSLLESLREKTFLDRLKEFAREKGVPLTLEFFGMIASAVAKKSVEGCPPVLTKESR